MTGMIKEFQRGRGDLTAAVGGYRTKLSALGVDTSALREIERVCGWIDDQIPMLIKRRDLAIALDDDTQSGLTMIDERLVLSPAEARRQGAALAARFRAAKNVRPGDDDYHELLNELGAHRFDSDYSAAFFASLGPELTRRLPAMINKYGKDGHVPRQIQETSTALASAVSGGMDVPGFGTVTNAMFDKNLSSTDKKGVASLVCHGKFPPEWLASLARMHALDPMYRLALSETGTNRPGIDSQDKDTYALFLRSLGNNPAASRLAFVGLAEDKTGRTTPHQVALGQRQDSDLAGVLTAFTRLAQADGKVAEQLGRAFAGASGAYDEKDGKHRQQSAQFAFTLMTALPNVKDGIAEPMRISMSQIAGSYATEIAEGSNIDDRNQESKFGRVTTHTPGLDPMFSLSPEDTYRFLKTFADSPEHMKPFQQGMGELTRRLVAEGVRIEAAKQRGDLPPDTPGLERVMQALGYVGGLQTQAEKQVQGNLDKSHAQSAQTMSEMIGLGIDFGSIFLPGGTLAADAAWTLVLYYVGKGQDALTQIPEGKTRLAALEDRELQASLGLQHSTVQQLIGAGYKMKVTPQEFMASSSKTPHPGVTFADDSGKLLAYSEIAKNPKALDNYIAWLNANGRGGASDTKFGQATVNVTRAFQGAQKAASDTASSWPQ
ncbi:hypothetical protein [Actinomadura alba]|uniref:Uncharacterized protein n=1 Tax=Actinomadura alba TaxID=406431 RepID=A0ABR7LSC7_9ACTN|nr:hypothetical protein [Actinomadura alba]MBC6467765.1 hypothetical protein [Actinomadura alba]